MKLSKTAKLHNPRERPVGLGAREIVGGDWNGFAAALR
jgi:hypothetical protein